MVFKMNKKNIIFLIIYVLVFILCLVDFPYYIDAPGGLDKLGNNIEIEDAYDMEGSINLTYVSEYPGKLPLLIFAKINKDWTIHKKSEDKIGTLDYNTLRDRQIILSKVSYNTSILYALKKANKDVNVKKENIYVTYIYENADTDIKVGDKIERVNGKEFNTIEKYFDLKKDFKIGDKIKVEVSRNGKKYDRYAVVKEEEGQPFLFVEFATVYDFDSNPKITVNYNDREMGPSGGLMIALYVYNALVEEDITGGKKIVGTGTLSIDGTVVEIGGIEYKIKGAAKKKADVFFAPAGENYETALKLKKKHNYKMEIVEVKTFDDALKYLEDNIVKK